MVINCGTLVVACLRVLIVRIPSADQGDAGLWYYLPAAAHLERRINTDSSKTVRSCRRVRAGSPRKPRQCITFRQHSEIANYVADALDVARPGGSSSCALSTSRTEPQEKSRRSCCKRGAV